MTSEIRANTIKNRVGLGTVSYTNTGIVVSGIVTANSFSGPYNGTDIVGTGITLTSTDAGSAAGPELKLFRNSASPANSDYLGQIKFAGESSTGVERNYAKITGKILSVTNGAESGILEFAHIKAGTQTITGRWRSDSLQLLNNTNFSVAGTSEFTGSTSFIGGVTANTITIRAHAGINFTSGNWSGNQTKIQNHNNYLYLVAPSNGFQFRIGATDLWLMDSISNDGNFWPTVDSGRDIGKSNRRIRNLYATTLYGDGSNLTGITQTTINNNANNRLVTATGVANTLDSEASLTFYNSGSDPILTIENSGNPQLRLRTTGTTDNCTIDFGDGDAVNRGRIVYTNTGDNMLFYTNGTSGGEKLKLYSNGRLNLSHQQSIHADTMLHVEAPSSISSGETNVKFEGNATMGARLSLQNNDTSSSANNQLAFCDAGGQSTSTITGYNTDQTNNYGELVFSTRNAQGTPPEERMRISKDGNVSIKTSSTSQGVLQINGDVTAGYHHGGGMYGMLAKRKFQGGNALGGYAMRYDIGYESPWIVGYNAGSGYNNQITFGSMTTSDRSLETGVQKRMVIDMASGKVGINSTTPFQTLDVKGSINGGTVNQPFLRFHDSHGDQRSTKHYFKCVRGSTTIFDIVTVDLNQNFHQALIILYYGARLQAISDSTTYPVHKIIGVNRFNGGNIQFTKNTIVQNANVANHGDIDAVAMSSTQYRIRLTYSGSTGGSSFCCGSVEIIGVGSGADGAFYSLAHGHGLVA